MNDNGRSLSKKRVLIAGGGGAGIGRAITAAAGAAGGKLAIVDIDADRAKEAAESVVTAGGTATPIQADVLSLPDIERAVSVASDQLGGIDALITVIGGIGAFGGYKALDQTADEQWDLVFDINLRYVFRVVRAAMAKLVSNVAGGTIVSVGSLAGVFGCPMGVAYGASKAGLISMAKSVSAEYGRRGIRMNVVSCGSIQTPGSAPFSDADIAAPVPLGRSGLPEEVAQAVVFLASPQSSYISGQNINIDGAVSARFPLTLHNSDSSMAG